MITQTNLTKRTLCIGNPFVTISFLILVLVQKIFRKLLPQSFADFRAATHIKRLKVYRTLHQNYCATFMQIKVVMPGMLQI